ncbi:MAG: hypothetical protein QXV85_09710 [Candidatus Bathyarchaeia archaeon]
MSNDDGTYYPFDAVNITAACSAQRTYSWTDYANNITYHYSFVESWCTWTYNSMQLYLNRSSSKTWSSGGWHYRNESRIFYVISFVPATVSVTVRFYSEYYYYARNLTDGTVLGDGYSVYSVQKTLSLTVVSVEETLKYSRFKSVAYVNLSNPSLWEQDLGYVLAVKMESYRPGLIPQPLNRRIIVNNITSYAIAYNFTKKVDCFTGTEYSEYVPWNLTFANYSFPKYFVIHANTVEKVKFNVQESFRRILEEDEYSNLTAYFRFYYTFPPPHLPSNVIAYLRTLSPPANFNRTIYIFSSNYTHNIWYKTPLPVDWSRKFSPYPIGYMGQVYVIAYNRLGQVDYSTMLKLDAALVGGEPKTYVAPGVGPVTVSAKVYLKEKILSYVYNMTGDNSVKDSVATDIPDYFSKDFSANGLGMIDAKVPSFAGQLTYLMEAETVSLGSASVSYSKPVYTYNIRLEVSRGSASVQKSFSDPLEDIVYNPLRPAYVYVNLDGFTFQCNVIEEGEHQVFKFSFPKECGGVTTVNVTDGIKHFSITLAGKPNYTPLTGIVGYVGDFNLTFPKKTWAGTVTVTVENEWNIVSTQSITLPGELPPQQSQWSTDLSWVHGITVLAIMSTIVYLAVKKLKETL